MTNQRSRVNLLTIALLTQAAGGCNSGALTGPAPFPASPPTIRAIAINGPSTIAPGESAQFTATASYTDGTSTDITATASWTTSQAPVLSIDSSGRATAYRGGEAQVAASKDGLRSAADVLVLAPGTYRVSGRIVLEGRPVGGLVVDVVAGTGAGASATTDSSGRYMLYGLAGMVEIRIATDGIPFLSCTALVTDDSVLDIDVPASGAVTSGCRRGL